MALIIEMTLVTIALAITTPLTKNNYNINNNNDHSSHIPDNNILKKKS